MFGPTITKDYLKGLARSASSDFLANGTPLTEAVVKQASACGAHLTSEHVRRICEMTYHDTYERMHKQACGADQYIVFDPPDAQIAAEILQSEKVASAQRATTLPSGGLMTEKTASRSVHMLSPGDRPSHGDLSGIRSRQKEWKSKSGAYKGLAPSVFSKLQSVSQRRGSPPIVHDQRKVPLSDVSNPKNARTYQDMSGGTRQVLYDPGHHILHRFDMVKSASAPEVRRFKFKPANAFDEVMKTASTDHHDPYAQAQGMHDLRKLHSATKEAAAKIRSDLAASDTALMSARRELSKIAYATYKDGAALEDILHACFNGTDWDQTSQQSAVKVASDLSEFLNIKVQKTVGLGINKHASFGDVNPNHPLPSAFTKVAALENQRVHLEIALGDIEQNLAYADEALKSALFGEKTAGMVEGLGKAVKAAPGAMFRTAGKAVDAAAKDWKKSALVGTAGLATAGVGYGGYKGMKSALNDPKFTPGGGQ